MMNCTMGRNKCTAHFTDFIRQERKYMSDSSQSRRDDFNILWSVSLTLRKHAQFHKRQSFGRQHYRYGEVFQDSFFFSLQDTIWCGYEDW